MKDFVAKSTSVATSEQLSYLTRFEPTQEVRFAVVLFGGVSLTVYINGVVQELLHLVRASAPGFDKGGSRLALLDDGTAHPLEGTEKIYREMATSLPSGEADGRTIHTRFVIDIVSGTSAGGINGIFLAKALANNLDLSELAKLWESESDLSSLLNDSASYADLKIKKKAPASLLNGRRLTWKILEALSRLKPKTGEKVGPLVDELDLHVTATDLRGRLVLLKVGDSNGRKIYEKQHKHRFSFKYSNGAYGQKHNDFETATDPFLAFSARATSAFPVAFEPATLREVEEVLKCFSVYTNNEPGQWKDLYSEYSKSIEIAGVGDDQDFRDVPFGDGGFLDNKPFNAAIESLDRRRCDLPVKRKLIYVEPSPEHPEDTLAESGTPGAIETLRLALIDLPRRETIREDLIEVEHYNELIRRAKVARLGVERDVSQKVRDSRNPESYRTPYETWRALDLGAMIKKLGLSYGAYHRLRVSAVADLLGRFLTRSWGWESGSAMEEALKQVVNVWRERNYVEYSGRPEDEPLPTDGSRTGNSFLAEFDFFWQMRRMRFVAEQLCYIFRSAQGIRDFLSQIKGMSFAEESCLGKSRAADFRSLGEELAKKLKESVAKCNCKRADLNRLSEAPFDEQRPAGLEILLGDIARQKDALDPLNPSSGAAAKLLDDLNWGGKLELAMNSLRRAASSLAGEARRQGKLLVSEAEVKVQFDPEDLNEPETFVRKVAAFLYRHFEQSDLVVYPLLFGTAGHEEARIDVVRISPEDATSLYDERDRGHAKLAGQGLGHFAAFLDQDWRRNDRIWGRLDAAERIIESVVVDQQQRNRLISRAHSEIFEQEFGDAARAVTKLIEQAKLKSRHVAPKGLWQRLRHWLKESHWNAVVKHDPFVSSLHDLSDKERFDLATRLMAQVQSRHLPEVFVQLTVAERQKLPVEKQLALLGRATSILSKVLNRPTSGDPSKLLGGLAKAAGMMGAAISAVLSLSVGQAPWDFAIRRLGFLALGLSAFLWIALILVGQLEASVWVLAAGSIVFVVMATSKAIVASFRGGAARGFWLMVVVVMVLGLAVYGLVDLWFDLRQISRILTQALS